MLKNQTIFVGRSYVNERTRVVREVVEELDRRKVRYNSFDLKDGRLLQAPLQICFKSQLLRWADREAKPGEVARIHPFEPAPGFEASAIQESLSRDQVLLKAGSEQAAGTKSLHRW